MNISIVVEKEGTKRAADIENKIKEFGKIEKNSFSMVEDGDSKTYNIFSDELKYSLWEMEGKLIFPSPKDKKVDYTVVITKQKKIDNIEQTKPKSLTCFLFFGSLFFLTSLMLAYKINQKTKK